MTGTQYNYSSSDDFRQSVRDMMQYFRELQLEIDLKKHNKMNKPNEELQFTPAPWYAVEYAGFMSLQVSPYYSDYNLLDAENYPNFKRNGLLAASAPAMYDLLKRLYKHIDHSDYPDLCSEIIDVLNKANPKQEND